MNFLIRPWLTGIELRNQGNVDVWNDLLTADRMIWGYCVDDTHYQGDLGRGWSYSIQIRQLQVLIWLSSGSKRRFLLHIAP